MSEKIWILTDLDHCMCMGRKRERDGSFDTIGHFAQLTSTLADIAGKYELVFVTDRGGAQLPTLAYVLNASRFHAGESGAVLYDAFQHTMVPNPQFRTNIESVPGIRSMLRKRYPSLAIEPGVLSSVRIERFSKEQDLQAAINELEAEAEKHGFWIYADHGDCLVLKPAEINKGIGLQYLIERYREVENPINFERTLWVGNSLPDIPAAEQVIRRGGKAAAVGNATPPYANYIRNNGWYIAEQEFTEGYVEILQKFIHEMGL